MVDFLQGGRLVVPDRQTYTDKLNSKLRHWDSQNKLNNMRLFSIWQVKLE